MIAHHPSANVAPIAVRNGVEQLIRQGKTLSSAVDEQLVPCLSGREKARILRQQRRRPKQAQRRLSGNRIGTANNTVLISNAQVLSIVANRPWAESLARAQLVHAVCRWGNTGWQWQGDVPTMFDHGVKRRGDPRSEVQSEQAPRRAEPQLGPMPTRTWVVNVAGHFMLRVTTVEHDLPADVPVLHENAAAVAVSNDRCWYRQGTGELLQIEQPDVLSASQFAALSALWEGAAN